MKYFVFLFILVSFIFPQQILATADPLAGEINEPDEIVACQDGGECNFCDLTQTINNVVRWAVFVALTIAVIILIYAGYQITASRGDVGMVTKGRSLVGNVALGIFIVILAWTMIDMLLKTTTGGGFGVWNSPTECGESRKVKGAVDVDVNLKNEQGIIVSPTTEVLNVGGRGSENDSGGVTEVLNVGGRGSENDTDGVVEVINVGGRGSEVEREVYVTPNSGPQ